MEGVPRRGRERRRTGQVAVLLLPSASSSPCPWAVGPFWSWSWEKASREAGLGCVISKPLNAHDNSEDKTALPHPTQPNHGRPMLQRRHRRDCDPQRVAGEKALDGGRTSPSHEFSWLTAAPSRWPGRHLSPTHAFNIEPPPLNLLCFTPNCASQHPVPIDPSIVE
jgi:hypothetical protein